MGAQTKGLLSSVTIWGGLMVLIPEVVEALNAIATLPILPPKAQAIVQTVGGVLAIFGRMRANTKIKGVL